MDQNKTITTSRHPPHTPTAPNLAPLHTSLHRRRNQQRTISIIATSSSKWLTWRMINKTNTRRLTDTERIPRMNRYLTFRHPAPAHAYTLPTLRIRLRKYSINLDEPGPGRVSAQHTHTHTNCVEELDLWMRAIERAERIFRIATLRQWTCANTIDLVFIVRYLLFRN